MTEPGRSEHLTVYGLVGVAMYGVVGVLVAASGGVVSRGWLVTMIGLWLTGAIAGGLAWRRTVWVPLLGSIVVSAVWMIVVVSSR